MKYRANVLYGVDSWVLILELLGIESSSPSGELLPWLGVA